MSDSPRALRPDLGFRRIALVLSGGGAQGAYAVGVLKTLEAVALRPQVIAGVSVGAMSAVAWAALGFRTLIETPFEARAALADSGAEIVLFKDFHGNTLGDDTQVEYELDTSLPAGLSPQHLVELMGRDKKVLGDQLTFVLDGPEGIEVVTDVSPADALSALSDLS